jgi:peptide/nickel transport system ATP-binding protein
MAEHTLAETQDLQTNFYTFEGVVRALNGVNIVVNQGETYGLVGESGCGKSVTVRSMMRIVQQPGRIDGGRIVLFLNRENQEHGVEIVRRTEAYMESIRGSDVSMIFQEPGAALNPVLSVLDQVGESYRFHRMEQMIEETLKALDAGRTEARTPFGRMTRLRASLLGRELAAIRRAAAEVRRIDNELFGLQDATDPASEEKARALNETRDRVRPHAPLVTLARHTPLLRRYRRGLDAAVKRHVVELLRSLGIPNPENVAQRYPHELSGGMQQRIVIAIALACHPTLLIADEPTSNLDVTIQAQIVELIKELKRTTISSVLFITHDLGLVAEVCDRVTVMYAGDVCETASVRDLFKDPLHPYSVGLLDSVPKVRQSRELAMIPGAVPNLISPPTGCRYHPRCPRCMEICVREKPATIEHAPGHWVACHLYTGKDSGRE